jgi:hypothetical protein
MSSGLPSLPKILAFLMHTSLAMAIAWRAFFMGKVVAFALPAASAKAKRKRALSRRLFTFPFLDQLHDIAYIPKALFKATGHGWRHANRAVNPGEIVPDGRREALVQFDLGLWLLPFGERQERLN